MPTDHTERHISPSTDELHQRAHRFRRDVSDLDGVATHPDGWRGVMRRAVRWMIDGFRACDANDLAAGVAWYALLAIVPTVLALISLLGLVLRSEEGYRQAISIVLWIVPQGVLDDSVQILPALRARSGAFGLASLVGFLWIGTTFLAALGRAMNRVYGVPNRSTLRQRLRGFIGTIAFALLFTVSAVAAILPTALFGIDAQDLPLELEQWAVFTGLYRLASYLVALIVAVGVFGVIFRIVPAAGQTIDDIIPGAVVAALAFVVLAQAFPVYLKIVSDWNLIGGTAGLLSLVLIWFFLLAHLFLFGAYINATWQHWRRHSVPGDRKRR